MKFHLDDDNKIGIIDSNRISGSNPTLNSLKEINPSRIDFILLSHPHEDHYSGLIDILKYCEKKSIPISLFGFTVDVNKKFLQAVIKAKNDKDRLANLWRKAIELEKSGLIKYRERINTLHEISVLDKYKMRFLAPIQSEIEEYRKSVFSSDFKFKKNTKENLVSLVTTIETDDWYLIFTSDAEKKTLKRIGIKQLHQRKFDKQLKLGQIPHHGSLENHYPEFWKRKNYKDKTPLAISTGPNSYGHPSQQVIVELERLNYKVELTWSKENNEEESSPLDSFSEKLEQQEMTQDLVYTFR